MHTKNQIVSARKLLHGIMLLAMLLLAFGAGSPPTAQAQEIAATSPSGVTVSISAAKSSFGAVEKVNLKVVMSNPNDYPVKLLKWHTPVEGVEAPLFTVTRDGKPVAYIGKLIKRPAPTEQDYISLMAGESVSSEVDLSAYYDLSQSGNYVVTYNAVPTEKYTKSSAERLTKTAEDMTSSNTLEVFVEAHALPVREELQALVVSGSNAFIGCSTSQQTTLVSARNTASTYANDATAYFSANKQGARYVTWFGVYNASRYSTVSSHFTNIRNATDNASPMTFNCTCTDPYYAYVYPNDPYKIYLCNAFWGAPLGGTDSKAGTLIHEISHFTIVADTDDYVYGQTGAKNLAITNPAQAIMNADNHEYFAENTPPLEVTPTYTISGNAGVGGATMTYTGGSTSADGSGNYSFLVSSGWSGTVTPSKSGYTFSPPSRSYSNVTSNQTGQNYTASSTGGFTDPLRDPSFEAYTPNPYWVESSTNYGTPLCTVADCGNGGGSALPRTGTSWGWFGGTTDTEIATLSQTVTFPSGYPNLKLQFYFWIGYADPGVDASDVFTVKIDGTTVFSANATQIGSYPSYTLVTVDVGAYSNGASHTITFTSVTTGQTVNFNLDDVSLGAFTFADAPTSYWAWDYIERLANAGITGGCGTGIYCPENQVTRAQMAVFLEKGLHYPVAYTAPNVAPTFGDTVGHWAEDWIEALKNDGITSGCAIGLYCPENPVTRAQMAVFLLKAKYGPSYSPPAVGASTGFTDVPTTYWAAAWIKQLAAESITGGCGTGIYCPESPVTRAQMAVFLVKAFGLP